jgi:hypothetical protein
VKWRSGRLKLAVKACDLSRMEVPFKMWWDGEYEPFEYEPDFDEGCDDDPAANYDPADESYFSFAEEYHFEPRYLEDIGLEGDDVVNELIAQQERYYGREQLERHVIFDAGAEAELVEEAFSRPTEASTQEDSNVEELIGEVDNTVPLAKPSSTEVIEPPKAGVWVLRLLDRRTNSPLVGDLLEGYPIICEQHSLKRARFWFWWHTIGAIIQAVWSLRPTLAKLFFGSESSRDKERKA